MSKNTLPLVAESIGPLCRQSINCNIEKTFERWFFRHCRVNFRILIACSNIFAAPKVKASADYNNANTEEEQACDDIRHVNIMRLAVERKSNQLNY